MLELLRSFLRVLAPFVIVLSVVFGFWYLMWKFVLEPNPLVRDFFDLDQKPRKAVVKKEN